VPQSPSILNHPRRAQGFSFLALSLVVALLGALLAVGLPYGRAALMHRRAQKVAADLRSFATLFQSYANDNGDWPAGDAVPGLAPRGVHSKLAATNWSKASSIGGRYTWDPGSLHQGSRIRAAIVIASAEGSQVTSDREQLLEIDRAIDDGDLSTGNFLLGYRNYPMLVLER
jgi:type II secretory pathway pseudopilin PulG